MLDTIKLRVNGINSVHSELVKYLQYKQSVKTEYERFSAPNKNVSYLNSFLERDFIFMSATNNVKEKMSILSHHLPSSNYKVRYVINYSQDNFEVEFSIPKYFYGTNVLQTLVSPISKDFTLANTSYDLDYHLDKTFEYLVVFVKAFFKNEFPAFNVDYEHIMIRRLDLCFNLVFPKCPNHPQTDNSPKCTCTHLPFEYLEHQKRIKKKFARESTTRSKDYDHSIFLRNADYSCKIYHKGQEYRVHDKNEHIKLNKKFNKKGFRFDYQSLENLADRTLRYEMTFFSSYMSKIFNQNVKTEFQYLTKEKKRGIKYSATFDNYKKVYNKISTILTGRVRWDNYRFNQKNIPMSKFAGNVFLLTNPDPYKCINYVAYLSVITRCRETINKATGLTYLDLFYTWANLKVKSYSNDLKALESFYNKMSGYYSKHHDIFLKFNVPEQYDFIEQYNSNELKHYHKICLAPFVIESMVKKFKDFINDFKVEKIDRYVDFKAKLIKDKPKGVEITNTLMIYKMICQGLSLDDQAVLFDWSKGKLYKYRARFKKMGITKNHVGSKALEGIDYNYLGYISEISEKKYHYLFDLNKNV